MTIKPYDDHNLIVWRVVVIMFGLFLAAIGIACVHGGAALSGGIFAGLGLVLLAAGVVIWKDD